MSRPLPVRAARSAPILLALAALAAAPARAPAQSPADRRVVELSFEGNRAFSDGRLEDAIVTGETRCRSFVLAPFCWLTDWGFAHERAYLEEGALPADLLRLRVFYRRRGYRDVAVDTAVERMNGTARVRFVIDEGPPTLLDSLAVEGFEGVLGPGEMRSSFPLQPGDPFDLVELEEGKEALADRLRNRGYVDAVILDRYFVPADSRRVELTLEGRPGPRARIGQIEIRGAGSLGGGVVRQHLTFRPGDLYRQNRILESQRQLFQQGAIRFASITTSRPAGTDTLVDVTVEVTPAEARSVRTGVGVTTTDCFQTEASFTHRNFLGGGRRLRMSGGLSNLFADRLAETFPCSGVSPDPVFQDVNFSLRADLRQPAFLSERNTLEAGLFLERETVPDLFVRDSRGGEITLTRRLRPRMPVSLTFRPELTSFDERSADVFFCVNFGFCQPGDIETLTEPRWLSPLILGWNYDRTNSAFSPTSGYYVDLNLEWADRFTGSDYQYARLDINGADFEELSPGLVLAVRFRAGVVEALGGQPFADPAGGETVIHPRKRFFVGGAQSVRGFGQNLLGPAVLVLETRRCREDYGVSREALARCARALSDSSLDPGSVFDERPIGGDAAFEANFELRMSLNDRWSVVGFLDIGQVWLDIGQIEAPVAAPGAGVRYASPVGPLRLDVGYDPTSTDRLPVVAEFTEGDRQGELVELDERVRFDVRGYDDPSGLTEFYRRLQLHISIGQAF